MKPVAASHRSSSSGVVLPAPLHEIRANPIDHWLFVRLGIRAEATN